jgi:hypothetical protein
MRASSPHRQNSIYLNPSFYSTHLPTHFYSLYNLPSSPTSSLATTEKVHKLPQDIDTELFESYSPLSYPLPSHINLNPHINLLRPSEPASPVTIASTLSAHSSPPPSPSVVTTMPGDNSPVDFQLYDESSIAAEHHQKQQACRRHDSVSGVPPTSNPGYASQSGLQAYYSPFSQNDFPRASSQQNQYLRAPSRYRNQGLSVGGSQNHASEEDDLPALSPHAQSQFSSSSRHSLSDIDLHSPATPIASPRSSNGAEACGGLVPALHIHTPTPKLGRTYSDAIQDELFNPGIAPGTSVNSQLRMQDAGNAPSKLPTFLQQAQTQRSAARATPPTTRGHSPFRADSPFHPAAVYGTQFPQSPSRSTSIMAVGFPTARAQREKEMGREAELLTRQIQRGNEGSTEAPKTISPKDAFLDYCEPEEEEVVGVKGSLFSQEDEYPQTEGANGGNYNDSTHDQEDEDEDVDDARSDQSFGIKTEESFASMATSRRDSDSGMDFGSQFFPNHRSQPFTQTAFHHGFPPVSKFDEQGRGHDYEPEDSPDARPQESRANRGAYTCTVSGCPERFPTPGKMSKHRREAHNQSTPLAVRTHHAGPHKCSRLNPTTLKPCNIIFSRPYDLTRHEDTIHNSNRQKVRCELCSEEKTFSRQDALTRHKKVKHLPPIYDRREGTIC